MNTTSLGICRLHPVCISQCLQITPRTHQTEIRWSNSRRLPRHTLTVLSWEPV